MRIPGVIVAGGRGTRLGGEKPLRPFLNGSLLEAVVARTLPQVSALAINVPHESVARYRAQFGEAFELLVDLEDGEIGPLNGVLAGLQWAERSNASWLATFPADTPFLPLDLVEQLLTAASENTAPAAARDASGLHGLCAIWPIAKREQLLEGVRLERVRSLRAALGLLNGVSLLVHCGPHAFFNVNTPEDLVQAEQIAAIARGKY